MQVQIVAKGVQPWLVLSCTPDEVRQLVFALREYNKNLRRTALDAEGEDHEVEDQLFSTLEQAKNLAIEFALLEDHDKGTKDKIRDLLGL